MTAPVWVEIAVSLASLLGNGFFLYQLLRHFLALRSGPLWKVLLLVTLGLASSMIIWVGDPNLLYTFPVFVVLLLVYSKGDRVDLCGVRLSLPSVRDSDAAAVFLQPQAYQCYSGLC